MVASRCIEEYRFEPGKKHPKINIKHHGQWHCLPYSMSPRTSNTGEETAKLVRRIIKGKISVN